MIRYGELTEAERRTLLTLRDGQWHEGSRSSDGDRVLGGPAARLVRGGLARRHVAHPNRQCKTTYIITAKGLSVLLDEVSRLASGMNHNGGDPATPPEPRG